ncbi:MAG: HPr family phosphocarrier protein [Planctomycetota bacterium]|jgi:phosphotransferase system HPr (HPr) family protein|nr:HPr family phosphocarrier protein [Planctomycetota bacterium]
MKQQASAECSIHNKYGFHVRPSTQFMQKAREFKADITVEVNNLRADGKSIMQLMALGAMQGAVVRISARGEDAGEAVAVLSALVQDRFGGID